MKNLKLTISIAFLGILLVSMTAFVLLSKAQSTSSLNPYDNPDLSVNDIISLYHTTMNDKFNEYLKMMMENLEKNPDDPNGKPYKEESDGSITPFTVSDCLDSANSKNYSTFCVSVNMLGGNTDNCAAPDLGIELPEDMEKLCSLGQDAMALKGYLNFVAALKKRTQQIFETEQQRADWEKAGMKSLTSLTAVTNLVSRTTNIDNEVKFAKNALDQTLSAYDQLRVAWPIHQKYVQIYADLEKYRDKIVDIRHQTDVFPKKFVDLTTTACI